MLGKGVAGLPEGYNAVARYYDVGERTQIDSLTDEVATHMQVRRWCPELCSYLGGRPVKSLARY